MAGNFPLKLFSRPRKGRFLARRGRFLVEVRLGKDVVRAYLPNPGRLRELLLPGAEIFLVRQGREGRKTEWTAVAVEGREGPVILHTGRTNDIAQALLLENLVPGLEGARIVKREAPLGRSRFDFLLEQDGDPFWLEVKSCTLLAGRAALFPDAVTDRGRRHLEELDRLARRGIRAGVLFVVHHPGARWFLPDWHTDPAFADAFLAAGSALRIWPIPVRTGPDLAVEPAGDPLPVPREVLAREKGDRGSYLVILEVEEPKVLTVGALGEVSFPAGFYVYAGSASKGLKARLARHRRTRKKKHWHIDYLREEARFVDGLAVRSSRRDECAMAGALAGLGEPYPAGFGAGDCSCPSHLFRFREDPRSLRPFQDLLGYFRSLALEGAALERSGDSA